MVVMLQLSSDRAWRSACILRLLILVAAGKLDQQQIVASQPFGLQTGAGQGTTEEGWRLQGRQ